MQKSKLIGEGYDFKTLRNAFRNCDTENTVLRAQSPSVPRYRANIFCPIMLSANTTSIFKVSVIMLAEINTITEARCFILRRSDDGRVFVLHVLEDLRDVDGSKRVQM
jgi:hypothetical protein